MRFLAAQRFGGPAELELHEVPDPALQAGQVRVNVSAVGLNFADLVQLSGQFQIPAPDRIVPGFELAGRVTEVAPDVTTVAVGQRVMALVSWGAYIDRLVVNAAHVLPVPDSMDDLTAAAFPVSYATAHVSLLRRGGLRPGETVIVTGTTGNVGEAALQVARARGARVIAVDRSGTLPPSAADHIVPPDGLAESVRRLTDARGADVALDLVGGDLTAELLNSLSWEGRLITTGFASGDIPRISLLDVLVKNIAIIGEDIAGYASRDVVTAIEALRKCLDWYNEGLLTPRTPIAYHFTDAAAALNLISSGATRDKLALVPPA